MTGRPDWSQLPQVAETVREMKVMTDESASFQSEVDQGTAAVRDFVDMHGLSVTSEADLYPVIVGVELAIAVLIEVDEDGFVLLANLVARLATFAPPDAFT